MTLSRRKIFIVSAAAALLAPFAANAAPEIYMDQGGLFGQAWEYALDGYDAVSYYSLGEYNSEPVKGSVEFQTDYKGVTWLFSSQENLNAFEADPEAYAPQYGNHCAWAMARNKLAKGDPEIWYIKDGKLYLNVSKRTQKEWLENIDRDIARGDENWPGILDRN